MGHTVVGKAVWSRKEAKAAGACAASIAASNGCHRPRHESGMSQEAHVRRSGGDGRAAEDEEGDERRHPQHPSKGLQLELQQADSSPSRRLRGLLPLLGKMGRKKPNTSAHKHSSE